MRAITAGLLAALAASLPAQAQQDPQAKARTQTPTQTQKARPTRPAVPTDVTRFDRCFVLAGERYGVSPLLLKAIARQESGLNPAAVNRNTNGSTDIGLMQINSSWLPTLARHGVKEGDLNVPCANILVGAWILGSNFRSMGRTVDALGAYNARDPVKRQAYARQVLRHYVALNEELSEELSERLNTGLHARLGAGPGTGPAGPRSVRQVR
ncbi:lytic transglycosylase domain-containing protein [Mitsuaria sp. 7]|uniref:lytic transglycosylase domain-containing protein n=1 Tax=Mitsuaria sp. 7 TaxID=1658665 RepID=UPI0008359AB5|nr:lytic transglycosylase domain-containing protein [Mitsuaria sp. 7]